MQQSAAVSVRPLGPLGPLGPPELASVFALLDDVGLPRAGVAARTTRLWVAEAEGRVVGAVGLEVHDGEGLLRSLVVEHASRGAGIGERLVAEVVEAARREGLAALYLLTTTAERWFPRCGFTEVGRAAVPRALEASEELRGACPASAVVMRRPL